VAASSIFRARPILRKVVVPFYEMVSPHLPSVAAPSLDRIKLFQESFLILPLAAQADRTRPPGRPRTWRLLPL
jgi:hypothetical protein